MATLVDVIGVFKAIGLYDTVFPFILVFALVYGLLHKFQPFGENKTINGVVALIIGLIFISFLKAVTFVTLLIPLITGLVVIFLLVLLIFMFMGVPGESIKEAMLNPAAYGLVIILVLIFVFIALAGAFPELAAGENGAAADTGDDTFLKYSQLFFHPAVLGLIVLLVIFATATYFITRESQKG